MDRGFTVTKVLALTGHPIEAAGARYRVLQFLPALRERGFEIEHHSFFSSQEWTNLYEAGAGVDRAMAMLRGTARRAMQLARARSFDVLWVHIWLHPITFPPFDLALRALEVPVVFDFDDAFYAPVGGFADRLRDRNWSIRMMHRAHTVVAGSEHIRSFVQQHAERVEVLPTAVDTDLFTPRDLSVEANERPVIGWVGSHSTASCLEQVYPALERLSRTHDFTLRIIGAGTQRPLDGVRVEWLPWRIENEVRNFRDLDIGLYPLHDTELARGKHGFKLNQYRAVGVPTVASRVGANPDLIVDGVDGFLASTTEEWHDALARLLTDVGLRRRVGLAARADVEREASLRSCVARLDEVLRRAQRATSRANA